MPTNLDRIQTLLQPEAYAKVRTLAKHNRRALSAMSAELVEEALKLPKFMDQIQQAEIQVPVRDDPRTDEKQIGIVKSMRESHYEPKVSSRPEGVEGEDYTLTKKERETPSTMELAMAAKKEQDLQQTIREQDERLKKMEEMMAQMTAMMAAKS